MVARHELDPGQRDAVAALAGTSRLVVAEGAAGAGKTTTLAATRDLLESEYRRMVVVTPTLKAARIAETQVGTEAFSAAWLAHQHGYRWDEDGHWTRQPVDRNDLDLRARLAPGDLLLVDEAGMLDQDTARALLTIADESGARVAFMGDRHQLPAVGRGGVLDHATRWTTAEAHVALENVHRFTDPDYARLSMLMRTGERAGEVFDALLERGDIIIHPSEPERTAAVATAGAAGETVIADTREQVADLNATIRDSTPNHRRHRPPHRRHHEDRRTPLGGRPDRHPTQRPRPRRRQPRPMDRDRPRPAGQHHRPRRPG